MSPPIITNTHPIYYLSIFYINHYHTHPNPIMQVDACIQISTLNYQQSPSTYHAYNHTTPPHQTCGSHQNPLIYYNTYVHMSMQRSKQINIQYIITTKTRNPHRFQTHSPLHQTQPQLSFEMKLDLTT